MFNKICFIWAVYNFRCAANKETKLAAQEEGPVGAIGQGLGQEQVKATLAQVVSSEEQAVWGDQAGEAGSANQEIAIVRSTLDFPK